MSFSLCGAGVDQREIKNCDYQRQLPGCVRSTAADVEKNGWVWIGD